MRVTKHPSTLLQDCILPLNVHQRQLWLRGWGCLGGNSIEGLQKLYFSLSMGNWSGSICVLLTCSSLQPLGNLVSHDRASSAACSLSVFSVRQGLVCLNPCEFLFISQLPVFWMLLWRMWLSWAFIKGLIPIWCCEQVWCWFWVFSGCCPQFSSVSGFWSLSRPDHTPKSFLACAGLSKACKWADGSAVAFTKDLRWLKLVNLVLSWRERKHFDQHAKGEGSGCQWMLG